MVLGKNHKFKRSRKKEQKIEASSHPENKRSLKKSVKKTFNNFKHRGDRIVYHIIPSDDNKIFYLYENGLDKPKQSFNSEQEAIDCVINLAKSNDNIRAYINNNKGRASRFI